MIGTGAFGDRRPPVRGIVCRSGSCFRAIGGLLLSDDLTTCFRYFGVPPSVSVPDSVRELCDGCFKGCENLECVTFGPSSSLERIGVEAFGEMVEACERFWSCGLEKIDIPDSVRELGDR